MEPGKGGLLRTFRCRERGALPAGRISRMVSAARLETRVQNSRSHRLQGGPGSSPWLQRGRSGGQCSQDEKQTSTSRSSGCLAPSLTGNRVQVLTKSQPEAAAPSRGKAVGWPGGITLHASRAGTQSRTGGCPHWEPRTESQELRTRTADSRLRDRTEIQNGWARNSFHEHLLTA